MRQYAISVPKLAQEIGVGYDDLRKNYQVMDDFPHKTKRGWPCEKISRFIEQKKLEAGQAVRGVNADLRREKLQLEVDILRDKRDEGRKLVMPVDQVNAILAETAGGVKGALNNWVQYVAAEKRDADLLVWAEEARDRAFAMLRECV